jgi:pyruvate dehydrogenase E2 component (dihydrolipoamide acetyltransferase)
VAKPVTMPQLGETVVEGTIVKWLKGEGDSVERDEPLFEISTDKVDTEVPSPLAGTIKEIKVQEGETVEVGAELAVIEEEGGGDGQAAKSGDGQAAEGEAEAPAEAEGKAEAKDEQQEPEGETPEAGAEEEPPSEEGDQASEGRAEEAEKTEGAEKAETRRGDGQQQDRGGNGQAAPKGGPRSHILSPLVRRLADEHHVDLGQVQGSGAGGRITKKDIMAFVEAGGGGERPAEGEGERPQLRAVPDREEGAPAGDREEVVQISHIRKRIAQNMAAVLQTTARAWNMVEVNFENIVQLRNRAKDPFKEQEGFSLTYMPFLARALCDALMAFPDVNATLDLDAGTATYRRYVNLGVAVAYEGGLIVPIVRGADEMNLVGLARAVNDVAGRARSKKLKPDEVHGGTFTITNPGPFGSLISVPIMNPGETAILAFDAVEKRPVVIDDAIAIRHMCYLSMSWDHRMIDGATAAQFLGRLKENLETWDFTPEVQAYLD